ncbi:MAG: hypothetical protein UY50_C0021G0010 [Parcubacteria group bacterium GW2011_GWA2_49_9]|nr:MAG: hypothetical protein UY50_C0021G0010 [Parcubacteria group bacterium GW2011_GWA2_49_9]
MGFENMSVQPPEDKMPPAIKPDKNAFEKFIQKAKTTVALGATLAGIAATTPDFEAHAAEPQSYSERGPVNDATRNDRFYAFTERYTAAVKLVKKAKTPDDAAKALNALNAAVTFVEASKRQTAGQTPSLDNRYAKSLKDMKKEAEGLKKFGVTFDSARLDAMVTSFEMHREIASHPPKKPNDGWIKTQSPGRMSVGVTFGTGSTRPVPKSQPKKK